MDDQSQGTKLSSMSRTVEIDGGEKAKFQSGGRAVNRRVNFATAIRNRKPEVYLNTVSDGDSSPPLATFLSPTNGFAHAHGILATGTPLQPCMCAL